MYRARQEPVNNNIDRGFEWQCPSHLHYGTGTRWRAPGGHSACLSLGIDRFALRVDFCRLITLEVDYTEHCKLWYADFKPVLRGSEDVW